jgi:beta propeller repeat protein
LATLQITDNDSTDPITDFAANLTFENPALSTNGVVNDSSSLFFVQPPTLQNISTVDGSGVIEPGQTATVSWFIIPTVSAGGTNPAGVQYNIGATLSGQINGVQVPASVLLVFPALITVEPDAQLQITYFTPRDVIGIDPFTGLGSPIPFTFGVLVQNVGYGIAQNVIIQSQQPKIVQNSQNLLIVAQLLGSRVNDSPLSDANLTVNLGNLNPGQTTKGAWDMIVTLSGTFLSVSATYQHSTALGGQETSLISSVNAYLFLHEVLDDQPGRDNIRDFLADTAGTLDSIDNLIPDSLYESQGYVFPVNFLTNATVVGSTSPFQVSLNANFSGWGYMRLNDPGQAMLPIVSVVRSDGKVLNTNNYWTSIHYEPQNNFKDTYLNIFDLVNLGNYTYTVTYGPPIVSTNAPVTTLLFAGPSTYTNGVYYVTAGTQMYFVSQDVTPVTIYYSLTNSPFLPAYPFSLGSPGQYQLIYYGIDANGNRETNHTTTLVLPGPGSLGFSSANVPSQPIVNPGNAISIRPGNVPITFQAAANPNAINAQIDIFQGVTGWATISNTPSSPTASTTATLNIAGQNVNFYMYQLNGGAWSAEAPVAAPLVLSGLPVGTNTVAVLGRSLYGTYLPASNAAAVTWVVSPTAPPTIVTGAPATPTLGVSAQLAISGTSVSNYQWTIDNSYYRPSTNIASVLVLSNLSAGTHVVSVLGEVGSVFQPTNNPTVVDWTINPLYGYGQGALPDVLTVGYTNIGAGPVTFNWDGLGAGGIVEPPGWYSVRITLSDALGDTNFFVGLAQVGTMSGSNSVLANSMRGPSSPNARGRWAVWQDQSDGNWEIYAQDVTCSNCSITQLTHTPLSQENPRTDGRYVVWQGQEANGNWDVFMYDMKTTNSLVQLTSTPTTDEINPSIDWPWVVYQSRATGDTNAPWLVMATNLSSGQFFPVSPSTQDELNPAVQAARVVWQDLRDQGAGQIYYCDLQTAQVRRLSATIYEEFTPAIDGNWIVWADNRNVEVDIYGFDLLRNAEIRITSAPQNESQPALDGPWLICMQDSLGPLTGNAQLIFLPSLLSVPLTSTATSKTFPGLADGVAVWQETISNQSQIVSAILPSLQPVFQNLNTVAITPAMVSDAQNAYGLLSLWGAYGVQSISEYTSLSPVVASQTALWNNGAPSGPNFALTAGSFLWVGFNGQQVLDLGVNNSSPINLSAGSSVFGYTGFPDAYTAFALLQQIGLNNAQFVRMLDSQSGRWRVAEVQGGGLVGDNFPIPNAAVLMVSVTNAVNQFSPQSP